MRCKTNPWQGFVLGLIGGAVGVIAMDYYQTKLSSLLFGSHSEENLGNDNDQSNANQPLRSLTLVGQQHRAEESSTDALGRIVYGWATGHEPDKETKAALSNAVHWVYGILQGGMYGLLRTQSGAPDLVGGAGFGVALWLFGDEMAVPMLGLQDGPAAYSQTTHLNRVVMHLVYGVVTGVTTKLLQWLM